MTASAIDAAPSASAPHDDYLHQEKILIDLHQKILQQREAAVQRFTELVVRPILALAAGITLHLLARCLREVYYGWGVEAAKIAGEVCLCMTVILLVRAMYLAFNSVQEIQVSRGEIALHEVHLHVIGCFRNAISKLDGRLDYQKFQHDLSNNSSKKIKIFLNRYPGTIPRDLVFWVEKIKMEYQLLRQMKP